MAEKRKLFAEVDKCFKKIDEGVELFEEIMNKVQEANSDNQREKYQDDLKKEIKKLQRLRDQVKAWQTSTDIKDKERLNQYRKTIENRMEQFKDIERENKTKPHSKQGLCAEEKLDPREKEKSETIDWLQLQLRWLNDDADRTETHIETLSTQEGGKRRGKKDDAKKGEKERKMEAYQTRLERAKFHIGKLEIVMRMVNNESLDSKKVLEIMKDTMEMFTETLNPDYEGEEEDYLSFDPEEAYEELNLGQLCAQLGTVSMNSVDEEERNGHDGGSPHESEESKGSRHGSTDTGNTPASPAPRRTTSVSSAPTPTAKLIKECTAEAPTVHASNSASSVATATPPPPPPGIPYNSVAAGRVQPTAAATPPQTANVNSGKATFPIPSVASSRQPNSQATSSPVTSSSTTPASVSNAEEQKKTAPPTPASETKKPWDNNESAKSSPVVNGPAAPETPSMSSAAEPTRKDSNASTTTAPTTVPAAPTNTGLAHDQLGEDAVRLLRLSQQNQQPQSTEPQRAHIPAWLGASPLGRAPTTPEIEIQLNQLESIFAKSTLPYDSERPRTYLPKISCPVASYYPQAPPPNGDSLEYYLRLTPETLFFIFYYMEGTKAQLLAAKALKKLSWRFHTKYLTWFQRHEEPKQITDDFEQGTYVYFDFEKWSQRKKEAFTFEYRFLEDKDFD